MKVALLMSSSLRHKYLAHRLSQDRRPIPIDAKPASRVFSNNSCARRTQSNGDHNPHTIGNNTLKAAGVMYAEVEKRYYEGLMPTVPQASNVGKLTTVRDISAELLTRMYRNFENGIMPNFLEKYQHV